MKALIVIDMQNDYYPKGKMELVGITAAHRVVNETIEKFRGSDSEVIFIQHIADEDAPFFKKGSEGAELYSGLYREETDRVFIKHYPNSFRDTGLDEYLKEKGIINLTICGAMTHMCIDTSVRAGYDLGYNIELIADGCATKDFIINGETIKAKIIQKSFLNAMDGTFCKVTYKK